MLQGHRATIESSAHSRHHHWLFDGNKWVNKAYDFHRTCTGYVTFLVTDFTAITVNVCALFTRVTF
jgi:hypothetical protein